MSAVKAARAAKAAADRRRAWYVMTSPGGPGGQGEAGTKDGGCGLQRPSASQ